MTKQDCVNALLPYAKDISVVYRPADPFAATSIPIGQASHSHFEQAVAQALLFLLGHESGISG